MILYENNTCGMPYFYSVYSAKNLDWPLHLHLYYECISVRCGTAQLTIGQSSFLLKPGDTAFICLNQPHAIRSCGSCEIVILQFSPDLVGHFTRFCRGLCPVNPVLVSVPVEPEEFRTDNIFRQKELLYRLCRILTESTKFQPQFLSFHGRTPDTAETGLKADTVCRQLHPRMLDTEGADGPRSPIRILKSAGNRTAVTRSANAEHFPAERAVPQIFRYVSEHFHEECNLKKLSRELGYDYTYLSRAFRSTVGLTFTQYLNQYRIHHACLLLRDTDRNISDIAYQCGYESLRSFNRNFRSVMGTAPGQWREQTNKNI